MLKYIYILAGFISLALGLIGIVTPGLPTTPFILLTAFLFAKSSPKLHQKLRENKVTGYYLNRIGQGLPLKARLVSIGIMWCMVCFSAFVIFDAGSKGRYIVLAAGVVGTVAQLIFLRKRKATPAPEVVVVESNPENKDL
ncbi:YbaN family protein [Dysgonomonas sp. 25]|uniref:YbaN family protein n=1 Tax=Dysgonomonas sp. 25 TaxID=2302933 RepID=UPI0013D217B6|nr:YbaN family protein [Dysgonomonas sp. 25]NDV67588.1 DUF454 domain-containing protein [Dysgonomonas sp. 25]